MRAEGGGVGRVIGRGGVMGAVASSDVDFGCDPIAAIGSQPLRYDKRTNMRGTQHTTSRCCSYRDLVLSPSV